MAGRDELNIRRLVLDVDKALKMPSLLDISRAIQCCAGVVAHTIIVDEIDQETIGTVVTIEGEMLDYEEIARAIENSGAVIHSLDEVACGDHVIEPVRRLR